MNKLISTFAGLAFAAGIGVAPAFAQGSLFTPPGTFTFAFTNLGTPNFVANGNSVGFNPIAGGPSTTASFALTGTQISGALYQVTSLVFTPAGGVAFTEINPLQFVVVTPPAGGLAVASIGAASDGTTFNLFSPVPEASTTVSLGLMLAFGGCGLGLARRRAKRQSLPSA